MPKTAEILSPWPLAHFRFAVEAASITLWSWHVDSDRLRMDEPGFSLWGLPVSEYVSFADLARNIHPSDRERVHAAFLATRAVTGIYETDFRILIGDEIRWVASRGRGADEGLQERVKFGVFINVTQRKQNEEANELLAGEMSHRVLNLLTIATALTKMTGKSAESVADMTVQLVQRLTALGRAHSLVRPLPGGQGEAALLGDLIAVLLAPYDDEGAFAGRVRVSVPRMGVGEGAATALAMIFHELATNSLKHGALSLASGMIDISSRHADADVIITWAESGGPVLAGAPAHHGFGGRIMRSCVEQQLNGALDCDWQETGLVATLRANRDRLAV